MMKAIVVADKEWNIGFGGKLLAYLPGDLKFFKNQTMGKTVVMGRKTFESLPGPKPLPGRRNIILSRNPAELQIKYGHFDDFCAVSDLARDVTQGSPAAGADAKDVFMTGINTDDAFVIGGGEVYSRLVPLCGEILVTRLDKVFEADTRFPDLDKDPQWELVSKSRRQEENGVGYRFTVYKRKV